MLDLRSVFGDMEEKFSGYLLDSIVVLLMNDKEFLKSCVAIFEPEDVFKNERLVVVKLIYKYWRSFNDAPKSYIYDLVNEWCERNEEKGKLIKAYLKRLENIIPNRDYVLGRFSEFIRERIATHAILEAAKLVKEKRYDEAQNLVMEKFRESKLLNASTVVDYLSAEIYGGSERQNSGMFEVNFKTFIDPYDRIVGGVYRKEFILVFGDTNVGKTFFTVFLAKSALIQGRKVLHVTLETNKEVIWRRYMAAITASKVVMSNIGGEDDGIDVEEDVDDGNDVIVVGGRKIKIKKFTYRRLKKKLDFLRRRNARLWIMQPVDFTFDKLVSVIDGLELMEGVVPDLVILDSPDQMISSRRAEDVRVVERDLYRRLLNLCVERSFTLLVTTQAQRSKKQVKVMTGKWVAESYDKVRIVDTVISLNQTEKEYKEGVIRLYVDKSRFANKGLLIEADQALEIGQFILNPRLVEQEEETDEVADMVKEAVEVLRKKRDKSNDNG